MNLQVINIENSEAKFLDETKDPLKQAELLKIENAQLKQVIEQMSQDFQGLTDLLAQLGVI